jgi:hypothetical protein
LGLELRVITTAELVWAELLRLLWFVREFMPVANVVDDRFQLVTVVANPGKNLVLRCPWSVALPVRPSF